MNISKILLAIILLSIGGVIGWQAAHHWPISQKTAASGGRKILYYQSAMHPWIKSDKPGKCTICGMDLAPVYEGEKGFDAGDKIVVLNTNTINVIHVQSEAVRKRPLTRALRVAGTFEDNETRRRYISAYVDGRIDRLAINFVGAEVREGQVLASFYSPALLAAEREYTLILRQPASTGESIAAQDRLRQAASQRLRLLGLNEEQIKALADKPDSDSHTDILAPMSGTVIERNVFEGQYVKEGDRLFTLADFSTMWLRFDAYERDLAWLRLGQTVEVTTPAVPGKTFSAPIAFIEPNINDPTRSAKVRVEVPNPLLEKDGRQQREIFNRLYADAVVKVAIPETLAVARGALLNPGGHNIVYVEKGPGTYEQRSVVVGRHGDDTVEILEGLAEGEKVVMSGNFLIDAQAQLNQSVKGGDKLANPVPAQAPAAPAVPMTEHQINTLKGFLSVVYELSEALAADELKAFNQASKNLPDTLGHLEKEFPDSHPLKKLIAALVAQGRWPEASDLKSARVSYNLFSAATVELSKVLRRQNTEFKGVQLFHCPMAPQPGVWAQKMAPLRNPFYGASMLDCGEEITP